MTRSLVFVLFVGLATAVSAARAQAPFPPAQPPGSAPPGGMSKPPFADLLGEAGGGQKPAPITLRGGFTAPSSDGTAELFLIATIKPKWHIYSITQAAGGPQPTKLSLATSDAYRLLDGFRAAEPPKRKVEPLFDNLTLETHEGTVLWHAPIRITAGVDPVKLAIRGIARGQVCLGDDRCEQFEIPVAASLDRNPPQQLVQAAVAAPSSTRPSAGPAPSGPRPSESVVVTVARPIEFGDLLAHLGLAFLGGLILNVMPCVLPVISLKILSFLEQAGESRARVFALNVWYSAGLMSVFLVLAVLAAALNQAWGQQFTLPWFKVALTGLVFAMALSFLGVWEIPIPGFMGTGRANELQAREGASGAFFKGVFATVLATPCSGPFLGPVFAYTVTQPASVTYFLFAAIGLGMASPYLVLGAFPALMRWLPRPGAWMETLKQLMAFLLLATVVYLFTTLSAIYFIPTLTLLVGIWFGCWLIGRTPLTVSPTARVAAWAAAIGFATLVGVAAFTLLLVQPKLDWRPFSPEAVLQAGQEGKTVMIDFSANWCLTCKRNLKFSIETDHVRELVEKNHVLPLLADWTDPSPTIEQAIAALGYKSIPLLVIYPGSHPEQKPIILSDWVTEGNVLEALTQAGPSKKE
jgi:thiol:disulfide interchange protein